MLSYFEEELFGWFEREIFLVVQHDILSDREKQPDNHVQASCSN